MVSTMLGILSLGLGLAAASGDQPCKADRERFCPQQDHPAWCLVERFKELQPDCQAYVRSGVAYQCLSDRKAFCSTFKGEGIYRCFKEHREQISEICRNAVERLKSSGKQRTAGATPSAPSTQAPSASGSGN